LYIILILKKVENSRIFEKQLHTQN